MLLSVFSALGPISNPTPPTAALTEFFHADTVASDHIYGYIILSVLPLGSFFLRKYLQVSFNITATIKIYF